MAAEDEFRHPNSWVDGNGNEICYDCDTCVFFSDGGWVCECGSGYLPVSG